MSVLISERLNSQAGAEGEITPLQSGSNNKWSPLLIYNAPENGQAWNKESLIAIRTLEEGVVAMPDWTDLCLAKPIPGEDDKVACDKKSFRSPLDLFFDKSKLEEMS